MLILVALAGSSPGRRCSYVFVYFRVTPAVCLATAALLPVYEAGRPRLDLDRERWADRCCCRRFLLAVVCDISPITLRCKTETNVQSFLWGVAKAGECCVSFFAVVDVVLLRATTHSDARSELYLEADLFEMWGWGPCVVEEMEVNGVASGVRSSCVFFFVSCILGSSLHLSE